MPTTSALVWGIYIDNNGQPWAVKAGRSTCLLNEQNGTLQPSWTPAPANLTPRSIIARTAKGSTLSVIAMNPQKFPWQPVGTQFLWNGQQYQIVSLLPEKIFGPLKITI